MGISGQPERFINTSIFQRHPVPLIRRFSGGGTVFVDEDTIFITFICNREAVQVACCPQKIAQWTTYFYRHAFKDLDFQLMENDYVIGNRKCGGNAQYLRKERWLHHSSLLWDFHNEKMRYLLYPPKTPNYRAERDHEQFLCKIRPHFVDRSHFIAQFTHALAHQFDVQKSDLGLDYLDRILPHRQSTTQVSCLPLTPVS